MKNDLFLTLKLSLIITLGFIIGACSTSNFQTRKYTKGIYHPKRGSNEIDNPKKVKEDNYYAVKTGEKPKSNYISAKDSTISEEKIATEKLAESKESKIVTSLINKEKKPVVNINLTSIKHFLSKLIQPIITTQLDEKEIVDHRKKHVRNYSLLAFIFSLVGLFIFVGSIIASVYLFGLAILAFLATPFACIASVYGRKGYKIDLYANNNTFMGRFAAVLGRILLITIIVSAILVLIIGIIALVGAIGSSSF